MRIHLRTRTKIICALIGAFIVAGGTILGLIPTAFASGPALPQGYIHVCINLTTEQSYWELHTFTTGNCANGYEQATLILDPNQIPLGSTSTTVTNPDVVSVTYPGAQTSVVGEPITPLTLTASSNEGHTISWTAASSPTGLFGPGELSINPATGQITGTATVTGTYVVTITATDSAGTTGFTQFTWTIT